MRKTILIVAAALLIGTGIPYRALAQLPELIDRELLFGNPEIAGAQISPDGKFIAFLKPYNETRNVWVKGVSESFDKARLLTAETSRPIGGFFWSQDAKYILFVKDNGGDENFNVYAVSPTAKAGDGGDVPTARNITAGEKVRAIIQAVPRSEPQFIYVGLNDRDPAWHDIYKVNIATGEKTLIKKNEDRLQGLIFDNADKIRLSVRSTKAGDTEILSLDGEKPEVVFSCNVFETCAPIRFSKDNKQFYMQTNKGERNLVQLVLLDPVTKKEKLVEQDPEGKVDFGGAVFSEVSNELIATAYEGERTRVYFRDKVLEADYRWLENKMPGKDVNFGSSTKDENVWIVSASSDVEPGETYIFDRKKKKLDLQYKIREKLPRNALAEMKPVTYKSSDGLEVPAYLTLPKGVQAKNLPAVIVPHGGPWGRDSWGYDGFAQFLANRGYAVLQPNFRASTGYGKKFLDAGNKQWGELMQDDITWGVKYLVKEGIADPKRVGIMGGSYGGYATLAGVTFTPDTYAAAVAIVAPSNLITLLDAIPAYWESFRNVFYQRMGDPNTDAGKAQLIRQSPLTHAAKITTPLMVVQGANDPRVNRRESDQIVIALRERNYPVEYLVADDEGHGFARPVNNMAMFAAAEKFLAKYLGGRYQESMTAPVKKRLGEITVDPKDVKLPESLSMNAAPGISLTGKWSMTAEAGGQVVPISVEFDQKEASFTGKVSTPFGDGTIEDGKVSGSNFSGTVKLDFQGQPLQLTMKGKVDGSKMDGNMEGAGVPPVVFSASKVD
jgi:dipeptidyl aminopeptidase/acylaminoacyl peptidase